jgi:hypothetical protein
MKHHRKRGERVMLAALGATLALHLQAQSSRLQDDDPVFGVWELDVRKSLFVGRPAPRSQLRIYEPHPDGLKGTVITVDADGKETTTQFVYQYDGIDYPFGGRADADTIALQRTGPFTATSTFSHAGIPVGTALRTISPDRNQLTIRVEFKNNINSIEVFRRKQ